MGKLDVKVGDTVIVYSTWGKSIRKVECITPKGFIKVNGILYYEDGTQRGGDSWSRTSIKKATYEEITEINKNAYITKALKKMRECRDLTYEQAVGIMKILNSEV